MTPRLSEWRVSPMHSFLLTGLRAEVAKQQSTSSVLSFAS